MPASTTYRLGPITVAWAPRRRAFARRILALAAGAAAIVAAVQLRGHPPRPGPTTEQRRLVFAAAVGADPAGLGRLSPAQVDRIATAVCAALKANSNLADLPLLADLDDAETPGMYANSRRVAAALAAAIYCPQYAGLVTGHITDV